MARTISFDVFDPASIKKAIAEVRAYRDQIAEKTDLFRKVIAEQIQWTAQAGFILAPTAIMLYGPPPDNDVQVQVKHGKSISVVFAQGEQAVFIEYGAGVFFNGEAGQSPHPWGVKYGYLIGEYGKGQGKKKAWNFYDSRTHGTPAAMPMFKGLQEAELLIEQTIKGVFG